MKMVHVVPHVDQEAAGPSYSVPRLCQSLAMRGHQVQLSCLAARGGIPGVELDIHPEWSFPKRLAISPRHARALRGKANAVDIVHNHSLWSMVNVAAGFVVPGRGAKLVTSPRGTLSAWALSRRRVLKQALWPLQKRALALADMLHATSEAEYEAIRDSGFRAPVAIIPNGIDLPPLPAPRAPREERVLLFLGRIHPTKGLDRLLQAWHGLQDAHPEWMLRITGTGDRDYIDGLRALAAELRLARVRFDGPAYGEAKASAYRQADLFVLPSHSENFGMAVAEALAHGCPVVASRGTPWGGVVRENCGWWVEHNVPALTAALDDAMSCPREMLADMGRNGRTWMERDFGWDEIAARMEAAYDWMSHGGAAPAWMRVG